MEYNADGSVLYSGTFFGDMFLTGSGGEVTYPDGSIKYSGELADGLYQGKGTLYNQDGTVLYTGEFAEGVYQGSGVLNLTSKSGQQIRYEGNFDKGQLSGSGRQYVDQVLVYEGDFSNGSKNGAGSAYDLDTGGL